MNNHLAFAEDVLNAFPGEAISASFPIRSLFDATSNGSELIKGEFGVGHWFEGVVEVFPSDVHTIATINDPSDDPAQLQL